MKTGRAWAEELSDYGCDGLSGSDLAHPVRCTWNHNPQTAQPPQTIQYKFRVSFVPISAQHLLGATSVLIRGDSRGPGFLCSHLRGMVGGPQKPELVTAGEATSGLYRGAKRQPSRKQERRLDREGQVRPQTGCCPGALLLWWSPD